jgi:hypothetical protein
MPFIAASIVSPPFLAAGLLQHFAAKKCMCVVWVFIRENRERRCQLQSEPLCSAYVTHSIGTIDEMNSLRSQRRISESRNADDSGIALLNFIRQEMRHEDTLIVQRIAGLFAVHGFLFLGYYNDKVSQDAKKALLFVGFFVSITLFIAILSAINTFLHWKNKWIHLSNSGPVMKKLALIKHPITIGWGFLPAIVIPLMFVLFWIYLAFFEKNHPWSLGISVSILVGFLIAGLIAVCFVESRPK